MTLYRRILKYLRPYKGEFALALLSMVVFGATDSVVPLLLQRVLDGIFTEKDRSLLQILPLAIVAFAVVRAVGDFGQQFLMSRIGHKVVRDMRNDVQRHVLSFSPDFFLRNSAGEMVARMTSDVLMVRTLLTDSAAAVIRDSIRIVALISASFYLDPLLAFFSVLIFPIACIPIAKIGKKIRKLSKRGQDAVGNLSAIVQEMMLGNRVVKIFCREEFEARRFEAENESLTRTLVKSERVRAFAGPLNEVLASLAISGVLLYGGYSVIAGTRTQGEFIAFLVSVFLMYDPFKKLSRIHSTVQQGMAGAQRIFEVLDEQPKITEPKDPRPLSASNSIELKNVTFAYGEPSTDSLAAISNVSLLIPEGKKFALVGLSGSGKSTLVDLIPRFIDPREGVVLLGGVGVHEVATSDLRSRIAMVNQHTFLFNDSIYNNILYGNLEATETQVKAAATAAYAHDFISRMPEGYQTVIGEAGMRLSGGERQRIAIARAILKNAPILILDEATASLDNRSEREVQLAIEALEQGRTSLIVAHRLSTVRSADAIVVMSQGKIVELGTHDELLAKGGEYSRLYALQFSSDSSTGEGDQVGRMVTTS